jgi:hypothetical protein
MGKHVVAVNTDGLPEVGKTFCGVIFICMLVRYHLLCETKASERALEQDHVVTKVWNWNSIQDCVYSKYVSR